MNKRWKWSIAGGMFLLLFILLSSWFFNKENGLFIEHLSEKQQSNQKGSMSNSATQKNIDQIIKDAHFQGAALLVSQDQIFYQQSYGYADEQNKRPNEIDGVFPIASLQKIITGSIILELVKEGKLKLDTTLDTFYPEIDLSQTITIQQLLDHNSGIYMAEEEPENLLTDQESQIDNVLESLTVVGNKEFNYTNSNYTLLAGIISKLTRQSYEEVIQKRVIDKLSLSHTYFWDDLPTDVTIPEPYFYVEEDYQADLSPANEKLYSSLLGAGNMYMSTEDFWVFIQSLANGQLFDQAEYEQLAKVKEEGYQAGMIYFDDLKYSEGNLGGYATVIYGDQDNQNLVILFANQPTNNGMQALSEELFNQLRNV
ncbi:serine hydrolase domain-containing protein [Enterococcus haemoperoxidus]|uniref:serine hydrolase domain-containing protein n=1 Tax=Enterococcus haemoperoxidus TaxID=155618 RepID=UPI00055834B9|nr:serine hydrolase domain-containing protein [Enterococcus haemoperoxidus]